MAKLLKHFGIGVKKTQSSGAHRGENCGGVAPKSTSVQELLPKSPTRYRSSVSLSSHANHDLDTHSLKSFAECRDHRTCSQHTHGNASARHRGGDGGNLSPKGCGGNDTGHHQSAAVAYCGSGGGVASLREEDGFDCSSDSTVQSALSSSVCNTATPPRLLDEYCDPVDLRHQLAESADLLGACAPIPLIEDDYSVPYEVKKIVKEVKVKERCFTNGGATYIMDQGTSSASTHSSTSNGNATTGLLLDDSFDEPWEWTIKLNNLAQNSPLYTGARSATPMMTPKKSLSCGGSDSDGVVVITSDEKSALQDSVGRAIEEKDDGSKDVSPDKVQTNESNKRLDCGLELNSALDKVSNVVRGAKSSAMEGRSQIIEASVDSSQTLSACNAASTTTDKAEDKNKAIAVKNENFSTGESQKFSSPNTPTASHVESVKNDTESSISAQNVSSPSGADSTTVTADSAQGCCEEKKTSVGSSKDKPCSPDGNCLPTRSPADSAVFSDLVKQVSPTDRCHRLSSGGSLIVSQSMDAVFDHFTAPTSSLSHHLLSEKSQHGGSAAAGGASCSSSDAMSHASPTSGERDGVTTGSGAKVNRARVDWELPAQNKAPVLNGTVQHKMSEKNKLEKRQSTAGIAVQGKKDESKLSINTRDEKRLSVDTKDEKRLSVDLKSRGGENLCGEEKTSKGSPSERREKRMSLDDCLGGQSGETSSNSSDVLSPGGKNSYKQPGGKGKTSASLDGGTEQVKGSTQPSAPLPSPSASSGTLLSSVWINTDLAVEQQSWYHGPIGRIIAEDLLRFHREGSFLVRQSESNRRDFSLSLKSAQGFLHMKIVNHDGKFILGQFSQPFDSIPLMIEFYCTSKLPIKGNDHICLVRPLDKQPLA